MWLYSNLNPSVCKKPFRNLDDREEKEKKKKQTPDNGEGERQGNNLIYNQL